MWRTFRYERPAIPFQLHGDLAEQYSKASELAALVEKEDARLLVQLLAAVEERRLESVSRRTIREAGEVGSQTQR